MKIARVLALAAGAFLLAPHAQAVVIGITSDGSATDPSEHNNSAPNAPNVLISPVAAWASAPPAVWVSYANTGDGGSSPANGTTVTFYQPFALPFALNTGSVTVWADDTARVFLDGVMVFAFNTTLDTHCAHGPIGCEQNEGGVISLDGLGAGSHLLTFDVKQLNGDGFGLLYSGSVESLEPVPEPGTLMLLGAGTALIGFRRRRA